MIRSLKVRKFRIRHLALIGVFTMLGSISVGSVAEANVAMPGGGGGYCAAEFQSCQSNGSWCTWYGNCFGVNIWYDGGGSGGGGGGEETEPEPTAPECGATVIWPAIILNGFVYVDMGCV